MKLKNATLKELIAGVFGQIGDSVYHIMQDHRLSLQTSPLLAKACSGAS